MIYPFHPVIFKSNQIMGHSPRGGIISTKLINNKWFVYFFIILGVLSFSIYGFIRAGRSQPPKLEATPSSHDFGEIRPEPTDKLFELKNSGEELLQITQVTTSCSCTSAEVEDREIEPGNSTTLTVTFDPTAMDPPIRGEVLRIVYVQSNDPDQEETKIEITANVSGGE